MDSQPRHVYTVSALNRQVRELLDASFPPIWIEGEISNLATPASGHVYFSLKDERAQVRCALFRNRRLRLRFAPENGQQVQVRARISLFEPRGEYQLIVEHMEEAGAGQLQRRFEQLKARLEQEGLFAESAKQPLPALPRRIGVITSPTGAAVRDVLSVLGRRFPLVPVLLYPTSVQGEKAPGEIVAALERADRRGECDVLLLVRGGGSLEDLWSFNEEAVARAIHASRIPVVSGVGHETDFTIADFVADRRAPTPSVAAETVTPRREDLADRVQRSVDRLAAIQARRHGQLRQRLQWIDRRLQQQHPRRRLEQAGQRLDELALRGQRALRRRLDAGHRELGQLRARLEAHAPRPRIARERGHVHQLRARLERAVRARLEGHRQRYRAAGQALHALSPLATLGRGYSITRDAASGAILRDASGVEPGTAITTRLAEGRLQATVDAVEPAADED